ncbi:hypothetical protein SBADM41S_07907 [Streptomyces badius]
MFGRRCRTSTRYGGTPIRRACVTKSRCATEAAMFAVRRAKAGAPPRPIARTEATGPVPRTVATTSARMSAG